MLTGSSQNRQRSRMLLRKLGAHGHSRLPAWKAGAKSFVSLRANIVNPSPRPSLGAGGSARSAVGVTGSGSWRKRRPSCSGADRGCNITSPCKRADFQSVNRDERTGRTFEGRNSK